MAVDPASGRVLVADSAKGAIYTYSAAGSFEAKLNGAGSPYGSFHGKEEEEGNVTAIGVEEGSGDIYVAEAERHSVSQYSSSGQWLGWITNTPSGVLGEPRGVAVASSGRVYISDASSALVDVFGPGVIVPDVVTSKASKLARTTAVLNGTVNGDGIAATYRFEWGTSEAYGQSTPVQTAGSGEEKIAATLGELHAGTTYFFRLVGESENGVSYGIGREFTTPPAVEALSTGPVQALMPTSVTLTGSLTPGGFDAHYYFEWGKTTAYGTQTPVPPGEDAGSGAGAVAAGVDLAGLTANTLYHYRLVGENSFGTTAGGDQKFTTSGPPRITNEAPAGVEHNAATIHAKINPDQIATSYRFEYGETTAYGNEAPTGGASIGSGGEPVAVAAPLTGLQIGTVYHYRVVAQNSAGTTTGPDQTFETVPAAPIDAEYSTGVNATEATLNAQINPLGHDTSYYFQYGPQDCQANPAGCTSIPLPPGTDIGAGEVDQPESVKLTGLNPVSTYHYRVLASNILGTTEGRDQTFTTQTPQEVFALSDHRAWELVSPVNKHGAPIEALTREGGLILASQDGNSITYVANGSIVEEPQGNRSPEQQQVISTRTPQGWSSHDIATPNTQAEGVAVGVAPEYQLFTPDLSQAVVEPWGVSPPLSSDATQKTMYLRDNVTGGFRALVTDANVLAGTQFGGKLHFLSATPDLSHVVLRSEVPLLAAPASHGLYEWAAGTLKFLGLLPGGIPAAEPELGFDGHVLAHAISNDGTRIVWTSKEENTGAGHLYLRDTAKEETLQLDVAQGVSEPVGKGSAQFQTANSDDTRVFFTDKQKLTPDASAEPSQTFPKSDLYECDIVEQGGHLVCLLKDLTVEHSEGEHAAVQGFLFGTNDDGTAVYLVAQGVLSLNANGHNRDCRTG